MATRNVKLMSVEFTTVSGSTVTAADTVEKNYGTQAYKAFMNGAKVVPVFGDTKCWLNFYAIEKMCVTNSSENVEFSDDTCKTESE